MRHVLYWLCVLAVALPMGARLFVPEMLDHSIEAQVVVGHTQCGIPTAVFDDWCETWPRRPTLTTLHNDKVLGALDALALLALLVPVLRPGSRARLAAPASFEGLAVGVGSVLAAQFALDLLSASSPALGLAKVYVGGVLHMLTGGFTSFNTVRKAAAMLWFWAVFAPPLFAGAGTLVERRWLRRGATDGGSWTTRTAGACLVSCGLVALFLLASLVDPLDGNGLPLHDQRLVAGTWIVVSAVIAFGLLRRQAWAGIAVVVLALAAIAGGPVGIFFGIYLLWQRFAVREDDRDPPLPRAAGG